VDSPHGVSTPEAYTSLAKGQAEVADNYMHLFVPRGAMAARRLTPRYINRLSVFPCQRPFSESVGILSVFHICAMASKLSPSAWRRCASFASAALYSGVPAKKLSQNGETD
jgi:hypothetical protein